MDLSGTPDVAGFQDAQARLSERMGVQIVLLFEQDSVWPDGTKLDPESGKPLDPWVQPVASGFAEWTGSASVGRRLANARLQSGLQTEPIGVMEAGKVQAIIPTRDYPVASGEPKRAVTFGREYKVENVESDDYRMILNLEPR